MKELMPILALDPATKMGWALSPLISGVWDLSLRRDESMGMKFMRLRGKLNELLENYRIQLVVYEAARHAAPKMQGALVHQAQLQAIIVDWATSSKIESKGYSPKEIKRWAIGNGNASKEAMVAVAKQRWPEVNILDDNHADALLLWQMATLEFKFLVDAASGKITPASVQLLPGATATTATTATASPSLPESSELSGDKLPAKILRAFRKAGRAGVPLEDKRQFLARLRAVDIPFSQIPSYRLAKVLKGELKLEDLEVKNNQEV